MSAAHDGAANRAPRVRGWWLPDALSIGRLLSLPLVLWLLSRVDPAFPSTADFDRGLAVLVLAVVASTDWLDGYLARRLHAVSSFGSTVDAVADKAVQFVPLFWFALVDSTVFPHVPLWMPVVLFGLDALLTIAWLVLHHGTGFRLPSSHNRAGRMTGWTLFALLLWITAGLPAAGVAVIGTTAVIFSSLSVIGYLRSWVREATALRDVDTGGP